MERFACPNSETHMRARLLTLSLLLALPLAGCGLENAVKSDNDDEANAAVASANQAGTESAILVAGLDSADPMADAPTNATNAEAAAETWFQPSDCVTAIAEGSTITYNLDDCSGPYGLTGLNGQVVGTFSVSSGTLTYQVTSTDLEAGLGAITLQATAELDTAGNMSVTTSGGGVGPNGTAITRAGMFDVSWDDSCTTLDGNWTTTIGDAAWATNVSNYERCNGGCPSDGASITYTGQGDKAVVLTINFDGTSTANYVSDSGLGTINLSCQ